MTQATDTTRTVYTALAIAEDNPAGAHPAIMIERSFKRSGVRVFDGYTRDLVMDRPSFDAANADGTLEAGGWIRESDWTKLTIGHSAIIRPLPVEL